MIDLGGMGSRDGLQDLRERLCRIGFLSANESPTHSRASLNVLAFKKQSRTPALYEPSVYICGPPDINNQGAKHPLAPPLYSVATTHH